MKNLLIFVLFLTIAINTKAETQINKSLIFNKVSEKTISLEKFQGKVLKAPLRVKNCMTMARALYVYWTSKGVDSDVAMAGAYNYYIACEAKKQKQK